jgi:hypothetical protein
MCLSFNGISQTWQDVGGGSNNSSHGLMTWNGKLINLGSYNNPCNRVSEWDGTSWSCLGGGVGLVARAGTVWNGNLVVVGDFWNNFQPCAGCNGVAMWDGTTWTAFDQGFNNDVLTCTVFNGDLIIGGDFTEANGIAVSRVVRWNTTTSTFESMGTPTTFGNDIRCMTEFDGELWVGGDFNNADGISSQDGLVKWDDVAGAWTGGNSGVDLVGGVNESVRVLYANPNDGNLYMGGEFPELHDGDAASEDFNMAGVAMYDGSNWFPLGTGLNEYCRAIHEYNGDLIVGGYFTTADGVACNKIAKWNTTSQTFSPMGMGFDASGLDEYVKSATTWNGIFFAGGAYTQAEGGPMNYIAQWFEAPSTSPAAGFNSTISSGCEGECINFTDVSTNSPTGWTWTFPGSSTTTSSNQNPFNICYPTAGSYVVKLVVCNTNGCDSTTINITIGTTPTVSLNSPTICDGDVSTLIATPGTGGGNYVWSPGAETTSSINVSPSTTTSYSVDYTLNGCSTGAVSTSVTVNPTPTVSVNDAAICPGASAMLTATPSPAAGTYLWTSSGDITGSISVSPTVGMTYEVIYTLNGCSDTVISNVSVHATFNTSDALSTCENTTITYHDGITETITGNTSHTSLLSTEFGCDSVIITSVIMSPTYAPNETIDVCSGDNYTFADGTTHSGITINETYVSSLSTAAGCDSIITTNINVLAPIVSTDNASVCSGGSYTYHDGTTSTGITSNETHVSTYTSASGCDSSITTTVNVVSVITSSDNASVCSGSSYTYHDGTISTGIITNETHVSNFTTVLGCDSSITTTITVLPTETSADNASVCFGESYTYHDGTISTGITASETHVSNFTTVLGCDSSITTTVTVVATLASSDNASICSGESYTYHDGTISASIITSETHVSIYTAASGCDSSITTTINVLPLPNMSTSETTVMITSDQSGASYQWFDCSSGFVVIAGENGQSYTPFSSGNYAVEVNLNGCVDTSACSSFSVVGIIEESIEVSVYPNPVNDMLTISLSSNQQFTSYIIYDVGGRLVSAGSLSNRVEINTKSLTSGTYILELDQAIRVRFVKL